MASSFCIFFKIYDKEKTGELASGKLHDGIVCHGINIK